MSFKVIGIGEVLWDILPSGPQLGGAPANFACHAGQLGAQVQVISRVGNDPYGRQVLQRFQQMGIPADLLQVDDHLPTGTATVRLDSHGSPHFTITEPVAWDAIASTDEALGALQNAHAVCFGTLAQRHPTCARVIQQLVAAAPFSALRVLDINLRQGFYTQAVIEQSLALANVVKLNDNELEVLAPMLGLTGSPHQQIEHLLQRFDLQLVALTRGEKGSRLHQPGRWSDSPGRRLEIVDTVGAGDAFTAGLVMGLLHRQGLETIHRVAVETASYVCSRSGATPVLPDLLRTTFSTVAADAK